MPPLKLKVVILKIGPSGRFWIFVTQLSDRAGRRLVTDWRAKTYVVIQKCIHIVARMSQNPVDKNRQKFSYGRFNGQTPRLTSSVKCLPIAGIVLLKFWMQTYFWRRNWYKASQILRNSLHPSSHQQVMLIICKFENTLKANQI